MAWKEPDQSKVLSEKELTKAVKSIIIDICKKMNKESGVKITDVQVSIMKLEDPLLNFRLIHADLEKELSPIYNKLVREGFMEIGVTKQGCFGHLKRIPK